MFDCSPSEVRDCRDKKRRVQRVWERREENPLVEERDKFQRDTNCSTCKHYQHTIIHELIPIVVNCLHVSSLNTYTIS
jgi:hypothetical protein